MDGQFNFTEWLGQFFTWIGHTVSFGIILSTLVGWLPSGAAAMAIIWAGINIYESVYVQTWLSTRRLRRIARYQKEIERLKALQKVAIARKRLKSLDR